VSDEFGRAGIGKGDLKTGAVIITGETATKANAGKIVHLLADRSGDFVVATAGADLEALLAGKGAGADRRSNETKGAVANIDIGGGTANAAIFQRGKPVGTVTFRVGGRLIRIDGNGKILQVSSSLRPWLKASGYSLEEGELITYADLKKICQSLCRTMFDYISGFTSPDKDETVRELLLGKPLLEVPRLEECMVSGGIGRLMNERAPLTLSETAIHNDIGPLLAHALKEALANYPFRWVKADETVRATVIGAGTQSMIISGATVYLDPKLLPLRNLPVLKLELTQYLLDHPVNLEDAFAETMRSGANLYDTEASPPFALALSGMPILGYSSLQLISEYIVLSFSRYFPECEVIAVICESDVAQALGQAIHRRCGSRQNVICIDQVRVEHGDYVDMGEPISGIMIPVVVKTLAFRSRVEVTGS
jgi:ethanolamine utilization protein EutA